MLIVPHERKKDHHKIAEPYLAAYADEMGMARDARRIGNGSQYLRIMRAAAVIRCRGSGRFIRG
jgi:hypothetical protein